MKNLKKMIGGMAMLALSLCFAACSSDDEPSYSTAAVTNSELKTVLTEKGYQFNEQGNLLLDDKANQTTSLDLSGTNISVDALAELTILPNLTDVSLANNGYGPVFDVTKLPTQITGLDLRGNEVYDFEGLVSVNVVNDERETTVLHNFTKLYLPESAKYNVEDLMPYYEKAGSTTDMQMVNASGTLEKYNTLREIPDEYFRAYLKSKFSSIFASDTQIDISKPMGLMEQGGSIMLWYKNSFADIDKIESIEGIEYFINNPYYKPFYVSIGDYANTNLFKVSYIMPRANITGINLYNAETTNGWDLSKATSLASFVWKNNPNITEIDLSNTIVGNQDYKSFDASVSNMLRISNFENLKSIILPKSEKGVIFELTLMDLPNLESIDMSSYEAMGILTLINLPKCDIKYPSLKKYYSSSYKELYDFDEDEGWQVEFAISQDVLDMSSTKTFIETYQTGLWDNYRTYRNDGACRWQ